MSRSTNRHQAAIDALLAELERLEHDHDAGDIDGEIFTAEHDRTTVQIAALLRTGAPHELRGKPADQRRGRRLPLAAGGLAVCAVTIGAIVIAVDVSISSRNTPGQAAGPDTPDTSIVGIDRDTVLADAALAAEQGLMVDAADRYEALLETDPTDAEALAYYGWMLARAGATDPTLARMADEGRILLDRAVEADPELPDARWFRAVVRAVDGDVDGARDDLARFVELDSEGADDRAVAELRTQLDGGMTQVVPTSDALTTEP